MTKPSLGQLFRRMYTFYHQHTPSFIKKHTSPVVFFLKFRILSRIQHLRLQVYVIHGKEKSSGEKITVMFLGDDISLFYLEELFFSHEPRITNLGTIYIWNAHNFLNHHSANIDVVIVNTDRFFSRFLQKKKFIILPAWVELKVDISLPMDQLFQQFTKSALEDIRVIKKNGYTYDITNDPDKFDYFYHKIRIPYLTQRLGKLTIPATTSYEETKDIFERGKLLFVEQKNDMVSGFFLITRGHRVHACYMGIADPSYYLSKGAGAALYYFSILWAKEHHMKLLDFGNNRSFLNNGSFQYKRKWGCSVSRSKRFYDIFGLKILNYESQAIRSFLVNNPFTYFDRKCLCGIVFLPELFFYEDVKRMQDMYYTSGMRHLSVVTLRNNLEYILTTITKEQMLMESDSVPLRHIDDIPLSWATISYKEANGEIKITSFDDVSQEQQPLFQNKKKRHKQLMKQYHLNQEQATQLLSSGYERRFEELVSRFPQLQNVIFGTFINTFPMLKRRDINLRKIDNNLLTTVFYSLSKGKYDKEAIPHVLRFLVENDTKSVDDAIKAYDLHVLEEDNIRKIVHEIVVEYQEFIMQHGETAHKAMMGIVMKKLRGKANGKTVSHLLKKEIQKLR